MNSQKEQIQNLILVATVDLYSIKHKKSSTDVIRFFKEHNIFNVLREQYDVLHTLDIGEGLRFVEDYLAGEAQNE